MNTDGVTEHKMAGLAADLPIDLPITTGPRITGMGTPAAVEFVDHSVMDNGVQRVYHCLINGEHVAVSGNHPVTIHGVEDRDEAVAVTLTLLCRDIRIGAPRPADS